ncbi:MAG: helix-turn-helix transcriptional regulator, partial [Chitinophagaceae bacterium]|nr:helix-turn-helix transcriptional regulator [Anaerolineae bacterium]
SIKTMSNGFARYKIEGGLFAVSDDTYLILNRQQPYTIDISSPTIVESFCLFFPDNWAEDLLHSATTPVHSLLDSLTPQQPFHFIERLHRHDNLVSPHIRQLQTRTKQGLLTSGYLEEKLRFVLLNMLQMQTNIFHEMERLPAVKSSTRLELYRRLYRARDFMEASLGEPLRIDSIAAVAYLSPFHFMRAFKQLFGQTPHVYLTQKRIERAQFLLIHTERSVTEICFEVGFESLGSFSTLFQRTIGLSPRAYRNAQFSRSNSR